MSIYINRAYKSLGNNSLEDMFPVQNGSFVFGFFHFNTSSIELHDFEKQTPDIQDTEVFRVVPWKYLCNRSPRKVIDGLALLWIRIRYHQHIQNISVHTVRLDYFIRCWFPFLWMIGIWAIPPLCSFSNRPSKGFLNSLSQCLRSSVWRHRRLKWFTVTVNSKLGRQNYNLFIQQNLITLGSSYQYHGSDRSRSRIYRKQM